MPVYNLTLEEFSDVELLALVRDYADKEDGYVTTNEMVQAIGLDDEHARHMVSSRFSWLRRYGALEKHPEETGKWRLSRIGLAMIRTNLTSIEEGMIDRMQDEKLLYLARAATYRFRRTGATAAVLMRREWKYGTSPRRFN